MNKADFIKKEKHEIAMLTLEVINSFEGYKMREGTCDIKDDNFLFCIHLTSITQFEIMRLIETIGRKYFFIIYPKPNHTTMLAFYKY